jgi:hypothetical protein
MEVGWNRKYLTHGLLCGGHLLKSLKLLVYTVATFVIISVFPVSNAVVSPNPSAPLPAEKPSDDIVGLFVPISDPAIDSIEDLLGRHSRVTRVQRARIARAVVASGRKHDLDPHLVASVLLVESSGNPFAISGKDAVGIMQIHVPTWGALADLEEINLFRVEDNVDLGTRILKDYVARHGLWEGLARYLGAAGPSEQAQAYVARVQNIYSDRQAD